MVRPAKEIRKRGEIAWEDGGKGRGVESKKDSPISRKSCFPAPTATAYVLGFDKGSEAADHGGGDGGGGLDEESFPNLQG